MSKEKGFELSDVDLQELKKQNTGKLSDEELKKVNAGKGDSLCCPSCGSDKIVWNNAIGFWICDKCKNVWS